jgi:general secretion pathway protein G
MVVITIMAMVMGAVAVAVFPALKRASCKTAYSEEQVIAQQVGIYRSDNNYDCPRSLSDLFSQKYISKEPVDPWGKPFSFKCPGEKNTDTADIWSSGPDKQEGTPDDIRGWMGIEQCNQIK